MLTSSSNYLPNSYAESAQENPTFAEDDGTDDADTYEDPGEEPADTGNGG
jgi:hypothetical protein